MSNTPSAFMSLLANVLTGGLGCEQALLFRALAARKGNRFQRAST